MGITDYSNILSSKCLENTFPDTRTENEPLFLLFLHPPSNGSKQTHIGSSTDGESMVTDGSCEGMNYVKHTMTQYNTVTSENGRKKTMRHCCK
eukprot:2545159-Ditylum_brightwellii.AAC.1